MFCKTNKTKESQKEKKKSIDKDLCGILSLTPGSIRVFLEHQQAQGSEHCPNNF